MKTRDSVTTPTPTRNRARLRRQAGLSIVELMIALAISAALLTATVVATNVSFMAYSNAAEQATTQAATRMVVNRLLTLIRTSTAHGPLQPNGAAVPPVTLNGNTLSSNFISLLATNGDILTITYDAPNQQLTLTTQPAGGGAVQTQPFMGSVNAAQFSLERRMNDDGLFVLDRGTLDITVTPDAATATTLELNSASPGTPIRIIASTRPRKID